MAKKTRYNRRSAENADATESEDAQDEEDEAAAADDEGEDEAEGEGSDADAEEDEDEAAAEDEEEDEPNARVAERRRMAAILDQGAKLGLGALANHLACHTDLSAKAAKATLKSAALDVAKKSKRSAGKSALNRLAEGNPRLGDGESKSTPSDDDPQAVADQIVAESKKLRA